MTTCSAASTTTIPTHTRAWTTSLNGISNLALTTRSLFPSSPTLSDNSITPPSLSPTQILIHTRAISLNYKDIEITCGLFKHHASSIAPPNLIPCADSVGVIAALPRSTINSSSSTHASNPGSWRIGDRVLSVSYPKYRTGSCKAEYLAKGVGSGVDGCLREWRVCEWDEVVRCPGYLSDEEACCLGVAGTTAWMGLRWPFGIVPRAKVGKGDRGQGAGEGDGGGDGYGELRGKTVLIQGTGGVSLMGVQLAKRLGMRVILTSGDDRKLDRAFGTGEALGLRRKAGDEREGDVGVNYRTVPAWDEEVLRLTGGKGVDVIFENGGGNSNGAGKEVSSTTRSFRCVAFGGIINSIGYVAGKRDMFWNGDRKEQQRQEERLNVNVLALARNVTVKGLLNGPRDRFEELLSFVEKHQIRPVVDRVYPFEEAREAMQYVWDGKHFGKVVIRFKNEVEE